MTDGPSDPTLARLREIVVGELPKKVAVVLVEYDPTWPERFEVAKRRIEAALGERALRIEHVGSTSVVGLAAKPFIDVCMAQQDWPTVQHYADAKTDVVEAILARAQQRT